MTGSQGVRSCASVTEPEPMDLWSWVQVSETGLLLSSSGPVLSGSIPDLPSCPGPVPDLLMKKDFLLWSFGRRVGPEWPTRGGQYNSGEFSPISIKNKFKKENEVASEIRFTGSNWQPHFFD